MIPTWLYLLFVVTLVFEWVVPYEDLFLTSSFKMLWMFVMLSVFHQLWDDIIFLRDVPRSKRWSRLYPVICLLHLGIVLLSRYVFV